jgi:uncharacterized protein involved in copper resistance
MNEGPENATGGLDAPANDNADTSELAASFPDHDLTHGHDHVEQGHRSDSQAEQCRPCTSASAEGRRGERECVPKTDHSISAWCIWQSAIA